MNQGGIAAQLYTVRDFMKTKDDIAASLRKVREAGYRAVEMAGLGPITAAEWKDLLDREGLIACSSHTPLDRLQSDLDAVIAEYRLWGAQYLAIPSMPPALPRPRRGRLPPLCPRGERHRRPAAPGGDHPGLPQPQLRVRPLWPPHRSTRHPGELRPPEPHVPTGHLLGPARWGRPGGLDQAGEGPHPRHPRQGHGHRRWGPGLRRDR